MVGLLIKFGNTLLLGYYWILANKKRILAIIWGLTLLLALIIQTTIIFNSFSAFIRTYGYNAAEFRQKDLYLVFNYYDPNANVDFKQNDTIPSFLRDYQAFQGYISTIITDTLLNSKLPVKSYSYQALLLFDLYTYDFNVYTSDNQTRSYKGGNFENINIKIASIPENNMSLLLDVLNNETTVLANSKIADKNVINEMVAVTTKEVLSGARSSHPFFLDFSQFQMPLIIEVNTSRIFGVEPVNETQGYYNLTLSGAYIAPNNRYLFHFIEKYISPFGGFLPDFLLIQYLPNMFPLLHAFVKAGLRFDYSVQLRLTWEWDQNQLRKFSSQEFSQLYREMMKRMDHYNSFKGITGGVNFYPAEDYGRISDAVMAYIFGASLLFFILGAPLFILCLFVTNYTFNLFYQKKRQQISTLKSRGSSGYQVFILQLFESLVLGLIAVIVATIASFPTVILSLRTDGLLLFGSLPRTAMILPDQNFYFNVFVFGFLIGFFLNIPVVRKLLKLKPTSHDIVEQDRPFWKKKYIDVVLVVFGLIGLFFISNLRTYSHFLLINPLLSLMMGIFIVFSPLILIIGLIFLLNRSYSFIVPQISKFAWRHFDGVIPLTLNNLQINFPLTRRTILMLSTTLVLGIILLLFPTLGIYSGRINALYFTGSDITVVTEAPFYGGNLTLDRHQIDQLVQSVQTVNPSLKLTFARIITLSDTKFMVINTSTFLDAAFIHPLSTFPHTTAKLQKLLAEENTTLFFSKSLQKNFYHVGETINKKAPIYMETGLPGQQLETIEYVNFTLKITGSFTLLSKLIDSSTYSSFDEEFADNNVGNDEIFFMGPFYSHVFVISERTYENYIKPQLKKVEVRLDYFRKNKSYAFHNRIGEEGFLYISLPSGRSLKQIYKQIENKLSRELSFSWYMESIADYPLISRKAPAPLDISQAATISEYVFYASTITFYIIFNSFILATIIVCLIVLLIFGVLYFSEHWKEFAVERVLGLKRKQIFIQGATAILTLYLLSFPISLILGSTLIYVVLWAYLSGFKVFPPADFGYYPIIDVLVFSVAVSLAVLASIIIATVVNSRKNVASILKSE